MCCCFLFWAQGKGNPWCAAVSPSGTRTDKSSVVGVFKSFTPGLDNCRMTLLFLGIPGTKDWGILQALGKHCLREASIF